MQYSIISIELPQMKKILLLTLFLFFLQLCFIRSAFGQQKNIDRYERENGRSLSENAGRSQEIVIVALLDTGVDTGHVDLKPFLWANFREIPANDIDDDGNGYVDDINGWNFLGNKDGSFNVTRVGTQAFREYVRLRPKYKDITQAEDVPNKSKAEYAYYKQMERQAGINSYMSFSEYLEKTADAFRICDTLLGKHIAYKNNAQFSAVTGLAQMPQSSEETDQALEIVLQRYMFEDPEITWKEIYDKNISASELAQHRIKSLDSPDSDPRNKVEDNISDFRDIYYGNGMMYLPDTGQGTVLAGIIVAGVYKPEDENPVPPVRIMTVRVIPPEGDAYDKDIASGIRYAVDNGAKIIYIGTVKTVSPDAGEVRKAIKYAARKDVLIVRAAGDGGKDIDIEETFPSPKNSKSKRYNNMIVVGASSDDGSPAAFSNYGGQTVDVFTSGRAHSTYPGNQWMDVEGSDVSGAFVAGVAAAIRSRFPKSKASEIVKMLTDRKIYEVNEEGNTHENLDFDRNIIDVKKIIEHTAE